MKHPTITNDFSSYHFQSELTVGNMHLEPNKKEYLTDWANRLNSYIDKEQLDITADKRNKLAIHLKEVINNINQ